MLYQSGKWWSLRALVAVLVFFIWMLLLDENNLMLQAKRYAKLQELKGTRDYYASEIKRIHTELEELKTNPETMEKFAREHYWMKRDNEDVFVIVDEKDDKPK